MKKKILLTIIFAFILIVAGYTISNAATYETDTFKINIPNKYKVTKTSDSIDVPSQYIDNNRTDAMAISIKSTKLEGTIIPDNDFLNYMVSYYREKLGANFYLISSNFVTANNSKGVEVKFRDITKDGSMYYYGSFYAFVADNYGYDVMIISSSRNYISSTEKSSIINSFKVKDTVRATNGIPFMDVNKSDWYYNSVKYVSTNKIITGTTSYTYSPSSKLNRGQLAVILWRMEGSKKATGGKNFPDVKSGAYYYEAVKWASQNKIVNGYSDGTFGPGKDVTREQLAVMLNNYAKYKKKDVSKVADISKFVDAKGVSSYAKNAVAWAIQNKIISGKTNGTRIDPKGNASRAEAAAMMQNFRTRI